jgi:hypothetical protein
MDDGEKGIGRGLIQGTIQMFAWKYSGKPLRTLVRINVVATAIRTGFLENTSQNFCRLS